MEVLSPGGNLAAEGTISHGNRNARWKFFYDTAEQTELAVGRFDHGWTFGTWKYFDAEDKLLAVSTASAANGRLLLDVGPGRDGVGQQIDQQGNTGDHDRLDMTTIGTEHLFVQEGVDTIYDQRGNELGREGDTWSSRDCGWSNQRKRLARHGEISELHMLLMYDRFAEHVGRPGGPTKISASTARRSTRSSRRSGRLRAQTPDFMCSLARAGSSDGRRRDESRRARRRAGPGQGRGPRGGASLEHELVHRVAAHRRPICGSVCKTRWSEHAARDKPMRCDRNSLPEWQSATLIKSKDKNCEEAWTTVP